MDAKKRKIIRSNRKTVSLELNGDTLLIRVPLYYSDAMVDEIAERNRTWIERQLAKSASAAGREKPLTREEIQRLKEQAKQYIPERVQYYAALMGVSYGAVTIRSQKTKWGSCSAKGNLNFNCLLMLTPPEIIDSVVVHELCHRKEMNHSERFYRELFRVFPAYSECRNWLKENGGGIMRRRQTE